MKVSMVTQQQEPTAVVETVTERCQRLQEFFLQLITDGMTVRKALYAKRGMMTAVMAAWRDDAEFLRRYEAILGRPRRKVPAGARPRLAVTPERLERVFLFLQAGVPHMTAVARAGVGWCSWWERMKADPAFATRVRQTQAAARVAALKLSRDQVLERLASVCPRYELKHRQQHLYWDPPINISQREQAEQSRERERLLNLPYQRWSQVHQEFASFDELVTQREAAYQHGCRQAVYAAQCQEAVYKVDQAAQTTWAQRHGLCL